MKIKSVLLITALFWAVIAKSQDSEATNSGVEKSVFNAQVGLVGIMANHELGLSETIALRTEAGLYGGFGFGYSLKKGGVFYLAPGFTVEPRWYYNIRKRAGKGRNIDGNAANFLTLSVAYFTDWLTVSNDNVTVEGNLMQIVPKWGIRRTIGNSNFNYELGIGFGYVYFFDDKYHERNTVLDLHARIGYRF